MLVDAMYWVRSLHPHELLTIFGLMLLIDAPRYTLAPALMAVWDTVREALAAGRVGTAHLTSTFRDVFGTRSHALRGNASRRRSASRGGEFTDAERTGRRASSAGFPRGAWEPVGRDSGGRCPPYSSPAGDYCPTVCVLLVGHNEAETIESALQSVWGSYPRLEIVVVDDGSSDGMAEIARRFAREHAGVRVFSRSERGGKSSALNFGLLYARAEVVVAVDTDSQLAPGAIREIVQPLSDPQVAAVSADIRAWNAFTNLATWLQGYEYRQTVFVGRMLSSRLGTLGIVSGAFGAFRRSVVNELGGWDAGSGEDGDLTLRLRKAGYRIVHAPYATCYTSVPTTWRRLFRQRLRWDRTIITFESRKHVDLADVTSRNFRLSNFVLLVERWVFNGAFVFAFWIYLAWLAMTRHEHLLTVLVVVYSCQLGLELLNLLTLLFYSDTRGKDLLLALAVPLFPFYYAFMKLVDVVAILDETFLRKSFSDSHVPEKVQQATWHW